MFTSKKSKSITFISPFGLPILLDPPESGAGGAERQFFLFGKGLQKKGWSVCYITNDVSAHKVSKTVMPVEQASFSYMGGSKRHLLLDWMSLLYAMWRADSHYYVIKTPAFLLLPMYVFTALFRRKLVFWAQTEWDAYPKLRPTGKILGFLVDMGISRADIILAQSNSQLIGFEENFNKEAKLIKSISGRLSEEKEGDSGNKCVDILWVGNSMANKRYEIVLSLAKMLPEYIFALAMNKSDPERYAQAAEECKLISNVNFLGEVNPAEMESWFGRSRLLLNTSVREGFPNTYLQAWQYGLPIVSICIDPDFLVTNLNLGVVFDRGLNGKVTGDEGQHANNLLSIVKKLLTDKMLYQVLSENALRYVHDNHSESVLVERLEQILQEG